MSCNNCNTGCCDCTPCDKVGPSGAQGLKGPKGDDGIVGIQGIQGEQGEQGEIGEQGFPGNDGAQGGTGPQGDQGDEGPIGPQGPKGLDGDEGPQGPNGLDGDNGTDGIDGTCIPGAPLTNNVLSTTELYYLGYLIPNGDSGLPTGCWNLRRPYHYPNGWQAYRIEPVAVNSWNIGDVVTVFGRKDFNGKWSIAARNGVTLEMSAFNSFVDNRTTSPSDNFQPPHYAYGQRQIMPGNSNYRDCLTLLYTGDDLWVVMEANFANGALPAFT